MSRFLWFLAGFALSFTSATKALAAEDLSSARAAEARASEAFAGAVDSDDLDLTADADALAEFDAADGPWFFLGCSPNPYFCRNRAAAHGFPFWAAVRQPWRCGYYAWTCYGRF